MDLGREMKSPEVSSSPVDAKNPKVTYPGFNLNDDQADEFRDDYKPALGDEFTCTVKLRVTSLRQDEWGNSIGFDMLSLITNPLYDFE